MKNKKSIIILVTCLIISLATNVYFATKTIQFSTQQQEKEQLIIENKILFEENRTLKREANISMEIETNRKYIVGKDIVKGEYILYLSSNENQEFKITIIDDEDKCKFESAQIGKFEITGETEGQWLSLVSEEISFGNDFLCQQ